MSRISCSAIYKSALYRKTMNIGQRIQKARRKRGVNQSELARALGVSPQSVQQWEDGTTEPRRHRIAAIAAFLRVPEIALLTDHGSAPTQNVRPVGIQPPDTHYPIISWVAAGSWHESIDHREPGDAEHHMPAPPGVRCHPDSFWLEVQGRSMINNGSGISYPPGSYIFVDVGDRDLVTGKLIVAKLSDTNETTFKRLNVEGGSVYLEPLNPQYDVLRVNGNSEIVGTVKGVTLKV